MQARAAIYCRISQTSDKRDKVADQERDCRRLAKREGMTVVQVYADDGISASSFKDRPGWKQLLRDITAEKFDYLLATEETRFARQPIEKEELQLACQQAGVKWWTLSEGETDFSLSGGELAAALRGAIARHEGRVRSERVLRGNAARRSRGEPTLGPRIFGFELNRVDHRPVEAAEVRWAYEHVAGGGKLYTISKRWNDTGVKTASAYREGKKGRTDTWSYATVRQMLLNPRYAGIHMYGGVEQDVKAIWQPIVERELFETVGAILREPDRAGTDRREPRWLLAGIALCGVCGGPMRSATASSRGHTNSVYRCSKKMVAATVPGRHVSVVSKVADDLARAAVAEFYLFAPTAAKAREQTEEAEARRLRARLAEVGPAMDLVMGQLAGASKSPRRRASAEAALDALEAEESELRAKLDQIERANANAAMLGDAVAGLFVRGERIDLAEAARHKTALLARFDSLPLVQRRAIVRDVVTVTVNPGSGPGKVDVVHRTAFWSEPDQFEDTDH